MRSKYRCVAAGGGGQLEELIRIDLLRTRAEVDEVIRWLTGYSQKALEAQLVKKADIETFIAEAPRLDPSRVSVKGVICGARVEDIEDPTMQEIRYLDEWVDGLANDKAIENVLRKP